MLLSQLIEDDYIPGGFESLQPEFEQELLNELFDEFDEQATRRKRYMSSIHSVDQLIDTNRSPVELWQRARLLIALHLYQVDQPDVSHTGYSHSASIQNDTFQASGQPFATSPTMDSSIDQVKNETLPTAMRPADRTIRLGLSIVQQVSLDPPQEYTCVDYYDVGQGYVFVSNVAHWNASETNRPLISDLDKHRKYNPLLALKIGSSSTRDHRFLVYGISSNLSADVQSVEFDCPFRLDFLICIPIFRLVLAFSNVGKEKSLMILFGDASRRTIFLSKHDIALSIHSVLYIHETSMLFIGLSTSALFPFTTTLASLGGIGRVLLYNTQPLQLTSSPLFTSEIIGLPFQPMEPIVHLCSVATQQAVGLLSSRYFVLWQHSPSEKVLVTFCNPHRHDFTRCHYNAKHDLLILACTNGLMVFYQRHSMAPVRRCQHHWNRITGLVHSKDKNLLLSSSMDHMINVWNLGELDCVQRKRREPLPRS